MQQVQDIQALRGADVYDRDGNKVGSVEEIYLDRDTEKPEWVAVATGLFGGKTTFVPLAEATLEGDSISVPYEKSHIKDAPRASADTGELSEEEESRLYSHFGLPYSEHSSDSGLPEGGGTRARGTVGRDTSGPTTDEAMTRSEEELVVGKTTREAGRARLRKYIVTEQVTRTVPVQREEVRVEREPITDANVDAALEGPAISEEEHEVVLHAEEPVAEKRVVPKERVRLGKDTVTEERTVKDDLRREKIDVDDDARKGA
jgi:uncharacterized protein (TIGR02271 family)